MGFNSGFKGLTEQTAKKINGNILLDNAVAQLVEALRYKPECRRSCI